MSSLKIFEWFVLVVALLSEFYFFFTILHRIRRYRNIFPAAEDFFVRQLRIPAQTFRSSNTKETLQQYLEADSRPAENISNVPDGIQLAFVATNALKNHILDEILWSINTYLFRNRGAAIDFVLVRSIVERKAQVHRQGIVQQSFFPALIGLLALILGMGIGLFFLPDLPDELITGALVRSTTALFLSSVKLAAIPLIIGLLLSIMLIAFLYPSARYHLSKQKNGFYNFIQAELLPVLFQDTTHSLHTLQTNLNAFQRNFMDSIASLGGLMNKNYDSLMAQEKTIATIKEIDVMRLAEANLEMFRELGKSADELQKFTQYLTSMDSFIANTSSLNEQINEWLGRTNELGRVINSIEESMQKNEKLQAFIQSHFSALEKRSQLINDTVVKVDNVLDKSLNELMEHTQTKIRAIRELAIREEDQLMKAFEDNKHVFSKLAKIDDLYQNFAAYSQQDARQQQHILEELRKLNQNLSGRNSGGLMKSLFGK